VGSIGDESFHSEKITLGVAIPRMSLAELSVICV